MERICTDVAFLTGGKAEMQGKLSEIKAKYRREEYRLETESEAGAHALCQAFPKMRTADGGLVFRESDSNVSDVLRFLADQKIAFLKLERMEPTLESLFMEVAGK